MAEGIHNAACVEPFLRKDLNAGDVNRFPGLAHGQGEGGPIPLLELLAEGGLSALHRSGTGVSEGIGIVVFRRAIARGVPVSRVAVATLRALALGLAIAAPALAFAALPFAARIALTALSIGLARRGVGKLLKTKEGVEAGVEGQLLLRRLGQHQRETFLKLLPILHAHAVHRAERIERLCGRDAHLRHAKGADEALEGGVHARRFCEPSREDWEVPA